MCACLYFSCRICVCVCVHTVRQTARGCAGERERRVPYSLRRMGKTFLTKNQKRRLKKKKGKSNGSQKVVAKAVAKAAAPQPVAETAPAFVAEELGSSELAKTYETILNNKMFRFDPTYHSNETIEPEGEAAPSAKGEGEEAAQRERKKRKVATRAKQKSGKKRMTLAELKYSVVRPEFIEPEDVASPAPYLLAALKMHRNMVMVPRHWRDKRAYLQGKRGTEESTYDLPENIAATGIQQVRQAVADAEEKQSLKQGQRERIRPKMGQMDIDYKILHDAFFRYKVEPSVSGYGELYYEGKELEKKQTFSGIPGVLSLRLREALGMPEGDSTVPAPWLFNMQRFGPPPAYPNLQVPGVNAPIPAGAQYGFHLGGWGQPPVDDRGRPLYGGDIFGKAAAGDGGGENNPGAREESVAARMAKHFEGIDKLRRWGVMETLEYEDDEEEEEVEDGGDGGEGEGEGDEADED